MLEKGEKPYFWVEQNTEGVMEMDTIKTTKKKKEKEKMEAKQKKINETR